ncbi:serine hydrolase domain-containing protein [Nocardia lijiangensis]|uniref:serine hydrolase domain-containing protein n=1 Tax=Nocardia lijiangensis TaxID=299618 RepID=UPI00082982FD|nr:serine hydrolase domain-containing protein [Nocardia lijiangensis]
MSESTRPWAFRSAIVVCIAALACAGVSCGSEERTSAGEGAAASVTVDDPVAVKVPDLVREKLGELGLSAAVFGVWRGDEELAAGALGESPLGVPANREMRLRVGQPMEPMLSTVLLQLHEAGVVNLDEPIAKWVPGFPRADKITPRMLANSTTGIADYVTDPEFLKRFYANPMHGWTAQEIFDLANARPPLFEPGASWAYAHSDLTLLGVVLEKATGKQLGELLEQRVFEPLGMGRSDVVLTPQIGEPILHGYTTERGVFEDSTFWNPTAFLHSGNMNATLADVARWVRALATGELLSDAMYDLQMSDSTAGLGPLTPQKYFAFGTGHIGTWLVMNPAFGGYNGLAIHEHDSKTTIVVYATLGPTANADTNNAVPIGEAIAKLIVPDRPLKLG